MTTTLTVTKKRFTPMLATLLSSSSSISGLPSDSDEDIVQKQQDVPKPQRLVDDGQTVSHQLVSSTPMHGTSSHKTSFNIWPSPILSQSPEQQNKPHKCNTKHWNKDLRKNKRDDAFQGRERALQSNSTTGIHKAAISTSDEEDSLVIRQSVRSNSSRVNSHPDPGEKVHPLKNTFHIITDSEEEIDEMENNNVNVITHKTGSFKGLSPIGSTQIVKSVKPVNQVEITSAPLRRGRSYMNYVSSLPSPVLPDVPPSAVKRKGTGTSQRALAESGKMTAPAQEGSERPAVISGPSKSDSRKQRRFSRNQCKNNEEDAVIFSTEKQNKLKFGPSQNSRGRSSGRFNTVITEKRSESNSRKPSGLRVKTRKKKLANQVNKGNKMTSTNERVKDQIVISAEENAHVENKSSLNQGMKENIQDVPDSENHIELPNTGEMNQKKEMAKSTQQEMKTLKSVPSVKSSEQKKFSGSAVPEQKTKRQSVSESENDLRRSKRKRVKPLEYWRGERIQYKVGADLCREVAGIDSGFPARQWGGAGKRSVRYQERGFQFPPKNKEGTCSRKMVSVPYGDGECELECFSTFRVESDTSGSEEQNFTVFTGLEVPGMSTGYVEIAPFCESHSVIDSNLVFHVLIGRPIVTVHETVRNMKKGEFFFVPQGVQYSVKNDAERKAVLAFTKYDN